MLEEKSGDADGLACAKAVIEAHDLTLEQYVPNHMFFHMRHESVVYRIKFRACVKQMSASDSEHSTIRSRRTRLRNRILASNKVMGRLLPVRRVAESDDESRMDRYDGESDILDVARSSRGHSHNLREAAEFIPIVLPSTHIARYATTPNQSERMAFSMELRLVCVAMDVALSDLRRGLVDQAYIFRRDIRQSSSSGNVKLGYDAAKKAREHARTAAAKNRLNAELYRSLRKRMEDLHWDRVSRMGRTAWELHAGHYKVLTSKDIECNTATYDVKDHSGRLDLPWFWKLNRRLEHALDDDEYIADCTSSGYRGRNVRPIADETR